MHCRKSFCHYSAYSSSAPRLGILLRSIDNSPTIRVVIGDLNAPRLIEHSMDGKFNKEGEVIYAEQWIKLPDIDFQISKEEMTDNSDRRFHYL
jgi:hypothetical protein